MKSVYGQTHLKPINALADRVTGFSKHKKTVTNKKNVGKKASNTACSPAKHHPMTTCSICNVPVRASRLEKHIRKVHEKKSPITQIVMVRKNVAMLKCITVVPQVIEHHAPSVVQGNISVSKPTTDLICPICGLSVLPSRLFIHQTTPDCMRWLDPVFMSSQ